MIHLNRKIILAHPVDNMTYKYRNTWHFQAAKQQSSSSDELVLDTDGPSTRDPSTRDPVQSKLKRRWLKEEHLARHWQHMSPLVTLRSLSTCLFVIYKCWVASHVISSSCNGHVQSVSLSSDFYCRKHIDIPYTRTLHCVTLVYGRPYLTILFILSHQPRLMIKLLTCFTWLVV